MLVWLRIRNADGLHSALCLCRWGLCLNLFCMTLNTNQSWQRRWFNFTFSFSSSLQWLLIIQQCCLRIYKCNTVQNKFSLLYMIKWLLYLPISLYKFTIKLPSKGICREVIGIASLTLCWNTVSESSTVTPEIVSLRIIFRSNMFSLSL